MKTIKKSELTRFFDIIAENKLDSRKKVEAFIANLQTKSTNIGELTEEGVALRKEVELIFTCHNYLSEIARDGSVNQLLKEYLK